LAGDDGAYSGLPLDIKTRPFARLETFRSRAASHAIPGVLNDIAVLRKHDETQVMLDKAG
jgi:hypothetical protein